jgi:hypothetical protein
MWAASLTGGIAERHPTGRLSDYGCRVTMSEQTPRRLPGTSARSWLNVMIVALALLWVSSFALPFAIVRLSDDFRNPLGSVFVVLFACVVVLFVVVASIRVFTKRRAEALAGYTTFRRGSLNLALLDPTTGQLLRPAGELPLLSSPPAMRAGEVSAAPPRPIDSVLAFVALVLIAIFVLLGVTVHAMLVFVLVFGGVILLMTLMIGIITLTRNRRWSILADRFPEDLVFMSYSTEDIVTGLPRAYPSPPGEQVPNLRNAIPMVANETGITVWPNVRADQPAYTIRWREVTAMASALVSVGRNFDLGTKLEVATPANSALVVIAGPNASQSAIRSRKQSAWMNQRLLAMWRAHS